MSMATFVVAIAGVKGKNGMLNIDGIVHVSELPLAGTRVVISEYEGPTTVLTNNLHRFTLPLKLQSVYLLSFEREGCATKQLLFDTHVSTATEGEVSFEFPFQVTLAPPPAGRTFTYAGPVGFIRYQERLNDFGYEKHYRMQNDEGMQQRIEELQQAVSQASASTASAVPLKVVPTADADAPKGHFEELAPTLSEVAPLVNNTGKEEVAPMRAVPFIPSVAKETGTVVEEPVIATPTFEAAADRKGREEELIVEPRRITTVVRLNDNGQVSEYRRVAHAYGGVFYFKDGYNCTAETYGQATGR
jgi:hypothetical protein